MPGGQVPLPGGGGFGAGVPLPGPAAGPAPSAAPSFEDIFGGGAPPPPAGPPGHAASLSDIFGDSDGGPESRPPHPFHGNNSVVVSGGPEPRGQALGDGLLDFIDQAGTADAAPKQVLYRIKKRSGRVIGPFDEATVLAMFERQELVGNEEASTDGATYRAMAQIPAFAGAIQKAMAAALSGLDPGGVDLPALRGDGGTDLPGLRQGGADLPGLRPGDPGMPADARAAAAVDIPDGAGARPAKKAKKKGGRPLLLTAAVLLVLVGGAGVAANFLTEHGWFCYRLVLARLGGETTVVVNDDADAVPKAPDLPQVDVPPAQLLAKDAYVAYFQGAELQKRIVDAGRAMTPIPDPARKAASEQARFLAYLVVVEDMPVFAKQLRDALTLASPGDLGKVIGEAALAYADRSWDAGLGRLQPAADPAKGLQGPLLSELLLWIGLGHLGKGDHQAAMKSFDESLQADPSRVATMYQQARLLVDVGEPEAALGYVDKIFERVSDHPRATLLRARQLAAKSQTREEGVKLLVGLSEGPLGESAAPRQRTDAFITRAEIALGDKRWEEALAHINKAVEVLPSDRDVRVRHGQLALKLREFALARDSFKKLLEVNAADEDALIGLARAKIGSRDALGGYQDLQGALEKRPKSAKLHFWFALAARELLKLDETRKHLTEARTIDPKYADPAFELVLDLIDQGKYKEALDLALKAEGEVAPGDRHRIRAAKSAIFMRQRNYSLAEKELVQALKEDAWDTDARVRYVELLVTLGKLSQAYREAKEARQQDPRDPRVIAASGIVEAARGDHRKALELFEEATSLAPNDHTLYLHAAASALALDDVGRAKGFVDAAGQLQPKNPEVMNYRGQVLRMTDPKLAVTVFREAMDLSPDDPRLPYQLGITHQRMGVNIEAKDDFQRAINLDPNFADAYYGLGVSLRDLGRSTEARSAFTDVTRIDKKRVDAHIQIAEILTTLGDPSGAISSYERAMKADPESPRPICEMGVMLVQTLGNEPKHLKRGVRSLEQCVQMDPKHPIAFRILGSAYRDVKNRGMAVKAFQAHLKNNPDDINNTMVCEALAGLGAPCRD